MKYPALLAGLMIAAATSLPVGAAILQYSAHLDGPSESPPVNASPGTGSVLVSVDTVANTLRVEASFEDLLGTTTNAHIHCCTAAPGIDNAGVAIGATGFPIGVTFGTYDATFDLTQDASFNGGFISSNGGTTSSARNALLLGLDQGRAYFNIHSSAFPGGEIRGFLQAVPEPGSLALLLMGIGLLALIPLCHQNSCRLDRMLITTVESVTAQ